MPRDHAAFPQPDDRSSADLKHLHHIASVQFLFGQYEKAEKVLLLAAWLMPDDDTTTELLTATYIWQGKKSEATASIERLKLKGVSISPHLAELMEP